MRFPISSLKFLILKLLNKKPRYGYEIIKEIEKKTDRKPSQGLVYPILHEFEEKGFVKSTWGCREKRAEQEILSHHRQRQKGVQKSKGKAHGSIQHIIRRRINSTGHKYTPAQAKKNAHPQKQVRSAQEDSFSTTSRSPSTKSNPESSSGRTHRYSLHPAHAIPPFFIFAS